MKKGIILVPYMSGNGGTETIIHNLFTAIGNNEEKIELKLVSIGGTSNANWINGLPADVFKISKSYSTNESKLIRTCFYLSVLPLKLFAYIKNENPDIIISTNPVMWTIAKQITKILNRKVPIVAWYHYSLKEHPIKKKYFYQADYFFAISSGIKKQLIDLGIDKNKIYLIFNPIVSDYSLIERPKDIIHFIYVGRLMLYGQKNMHELFDALSNVKGKWVLDVYGAAFGPKAQRVTDQIKSYIEDRGISEKIRFHGFKKKPWMKIDKANAIILTSKYEGLPTVLCEAISHGVYCVSSNIETGPADIINKRNGKLFISGKSSELSKILQNIVDDSGTLPSQEEIRKTSFTFSVKNYKKVFLKSLYEILEQ